MIRVRWASAEDRAVLASLDQRSWSSAQTPGELPLSSTGFGSDLTRVRVALDGDCAVVGYVEAGPATPLDSGRHVWRVDAIAVDPSVRGQGVASELMGVLLEDARAAGCRKLVVCVLSTNIAAKHLYDRHGFGREAVLREEFCIQGRWVDDERWVRWLSQERPDEPEWVAGGCHCGEVSFEVRIVDWDCLECDCSICTKKGFLHRIVEPEDLRWVTDPKLQSSYRFHTETAQHLFCSRCGIHAAYRPRSHPGKWDVNVRCLPVHLQSAFRVRPFQGSRWEEEIRRWRT